jgi:PAS domain S-box-containing protein
MTDSCLIVDDEQNICLLLRDFLTENGFDATAVHSKQSAFAALSSREYDVVLVDKNLPDGSGMEVIAEVRRLGHQSEIIIITGYSDLESAIEAFSFGVFRYIKKPFDLAHLAVETSGALETHNLKKNLALRTRELEALNRNLIESERRFRELSELLPGILVEADKNGDVIFVNRMGPASIGIDAQAFSKQLASGEIFTDECRDDWQAYKVKVSAGEMPEVIELEMLRRDGSKMPVLVQADSIKGIGAQCGFRAIFLDITTRKAAEQALKLKEAELQLAQKMEAVGALAGGVAHDFNNMLGVIRGFSDVVLLDLHEKDPVRSDIEGIIEAAERAADLTQRLLAFGKKQILIPQTINLNQVIQGMEKMIARLLPEDIAFETRLSMRPLYIYADKGQIEQVIVNLVVNARDAMPDGGSLVVESLGPEVKEDGTKIVRFIVQDTGIGMDEETKLRIFEPFFTTKQPGKGTGLGLATVFGIVRQSGGSIAVLSAPRKGARFEVIFPLCKDAAVKISSVPPTLQSLKGSETVLVVEDESMLLQVVARLLRNFGYTVLTASQPGDALLLCEKETDPIDLLLVDVVMPRMNGSALADRLRSIHPEMRVLYMSGYSDFTVVRQVMSENLDCFIAKPFCAEDLAAKVRQVMAMPLR